MVIGGGAAGLKAAETLVRRQHKVVLHEKEKDLGGQVRLAAKTPPREEFGEVTRYLSTQVKKLGVEIRLESEVNADMVMQVNPDVVIVATGSRPLRNLFFKSRLVEEEITGVYRNHVLTIQEVLSEPFTIGESVVVVDDDGTQRTWGVAEWLLDRHKKVEIVTGRVSAEAS